MKIRVIGAGWYGCSLSRALIADGHDVVIHEIADRLFAGASGANPARLHLGFHYPRSSATRKLSQTHYKRFMSEYGFLTRGIRCNVYAVARDESLVDFGNYIDTLEKEVEFIRIERPEEFGLANVEGAVLTGERVCLVNKARSFFEKALGNHIRLNSHPGEIASKEWDWNIDCTFCALDGENVDRYEPCVVYILKKKDGVSDESITIMDGPFPSVYAFGVEWKGLATLTSAKYTPIDRCATRKEAEVAIAGFGEVEARTRLDQSTSLTQRFYPKFLERYDVLEHRLAIRAMPKSGADSRIFGVKVNGNVIRIMAGKIDALFAAADEVRKIINA